MSLWLPPEGMPCPSVHGSRQCRCHPSDVSGCASSSGRQGFVSTVSRDGPGVGAWFWAFAASKDLLKARRPPETPLTITDLLLAGSSAGIAFWTGKKG